MPPDSFDPSELGAISAAITQTIAEARVVIVAGKVDTSVRKALQNARSLYQILLEKLALAGQRVIEMLSEEFAVMARALDELEMRIVMGPSLPR